MEANKIFKEYMEQEGNLDLRSVLQATEEDSVTFTSSRVTPVQEAAKASNNLGSMQIPSEQAKRPEDVSRDNLVDDAKPKHLFLNEIEDAINVNGTEQQMYDLQWSQLPLSQELLRGIHQKGFEKPSRIQQVALPLILNSGANIIAQAKNGSGKTATFALSLLSKVEKDASVIQGMCLCPTRELAVQNVQVISQLGQFTNIRTFLGIPQCEPYEPYKGYQLYVGTPGKTLEFARKRIINFMSTKIMVMDEADELINQENNMGPQVLQIRYMFRGPIQILLFSATFSDEVYKFAQRVAPDAHMIQVKRENLTLDCVEQRYMVCVDNEDKFKKLCDFYASMIIGQSVIFVNSRHTAFDLSRRMHDNGHAVSLLCGTIGPNAGGSTMTPEIRDRIMGEFKDGETKVLICTDVLSRGIDVPQVTLVVNYELPYLYSGSARSFGRRPICMETYLHRIGRTGRFGAKGMAINMVLPEEMELLESIKQFYNCNIDALECDPESIENLLRNIRG